MKTAAPFVFSLATGNCASDRQIKLDRRPLAGMPAGRRRSFRNPAPL